jgi:hypothetical protein
MLPALGTLAVYGLASAVALGLAHRYVTPIPLRAALLLCAAPLLFTGPAIFTGGILAPLDIAYQAEPLHAVAVAHGTARTADPLLVDVVAQMLPWRQAVRESLAQGRFPVWNRFVLSGEPLLGVAQPAIFHPATWMGLVLPLPQAWNFEISLRLLIALGSAYLFFRGLAAGQVPALLGAVAWAFADFLIFFVGYPVASSVAPFPLLALGLLRLVEAPGRRSVGLTVFALALIIVAGHPETLLFAVTGGGVFFLGELAAAGPGRRAGPVLLSLVAGALALGLTAVVLWPFLEILPQTWQHALRQNPQAWGARAAPLNECLRRMLPNLVPYGYGVLGRSTVVDGFGVAAGYAGALLSPFALAGLAGHARRRWMFLGLAAFGLAANARLSAVAGPLSKLPLFEIAVNDYFIFLTLFGVASLAVLGAERLSRGEGAAPFVAGAVATAGGVLWIVAARAGDLRQLGLEGGYLRARVLWQTAPLLGAALLVGALARRGRLGAGAVALLGVLLLAERRAEEGEVYPTYPVSAFYPPISVLDPIPRREPVRMVALQYTFAPNIAAMYGIEDVRGYEAMTFGRYADLYGMWCDPMPASYNRVDDPSTAMLGLLGARYVLVGPDATPPASWKVVAEERGSRLVENPRALGRAFVPAHVAWIGDDALALQVTRTIGDFARDGVVGAARTEVLGWLPNGPADVEVTGYGADRLSVSVDAPASVFVGTSIPAWKGWRLTLDGVPTPLVPFDHAFLGFAVPAGRHEAALRYLPDGFVYGAGVSAATALASIALALVRRQRRGPGPATRRPA